jgi:hypothetical protein
MSTHDSITHYGQGRTWRAPWRLVWRLLRAVVPWRRGTARPVRVGRRDRRRLGAMECALAAEAPQLASMFAMFAQLAVGESHDGAERLPRSARSWRWQGPRRVHVALLLAFAGLVALCVTLSFRVQPSSRNCLTSSPSTSATSAGSAGSPAFRARAVAAFAPARTPGCPAYSTYSK